MQKELLTQFQGKEVNIEFQNSFSLRGIISEVDDDGFFIFRTNQKTSMLHISQIISIVPVNNH